MIQAKPGDWVGIHRIVLPAGQRAPQVPADTQKVPLEMRVKGFALTAGDVGNPMEIRTISGRRMQGVLEIVNPAYPHGYGSPLPELMKIGHELRTILEEESS